MSGACVPQAGAFPLLVLQSNITLIYLAYNSSLLEHLVKSSCARHARIYPIRLRLHDLPFVYEHASPNVSLRRFGHTRLARHNPYARWLTRIPRDDIHRRDHLSTSSQPPICARL